MSDEIIDAVARSRMDAHEDICAARYLELSAALSSLNSRIFGAAGVVVVLLAGVIVTLMTRAH